MSIEQIFPGHQKDLGGGFKVRRCLPATNRQAIGPFLFFDHFGPVSFTPPHTHDVRPHPHIGLATVTYLFKGAMMHRDSLGNQQRIEPGAINWMTAGRGIVHSERSPEDLKDKTYESHGLQLWAALPLAHEQTEPSFSHIPASAIPTVVLPGTEIKVLVGHFLKAGKRTISPVATFTPTLYLDIALTPDVVFELPALEKEQAIYSVDQSLQINGEILAPFELALLETGKSVKISTHTSARFVVIGGASLESERFIWWNFVSSKKQYIHEAAEAWKTGKMGQVPGEKEFIPLPKSIFE